MHGRAPSAFRRGAADPPWLEVDADEDNSGGSTSSVLSRAYPAHSGELDQVSGFEAPLEDQTINPLLLQKVPEVTDDAITSDFWTLSPQA